MKPVRIEDLFKYRFLSSLEFSPRGDQAALIIKRADLESNGYRSDIALVDVASSKLRQLTSSGKDGPFVWTHEGDAIIFASKRDDEQDAPAASTRLYRIAISGGEAQLETELPHRAETFRLLNDGRILFTARVPLDPEAAEAEDAADYEVLEEIPFWQNGKGFTSRKRVRLFAFDPISKTLETLSEPELEIQYLDVRGAQIAYVARRFAGKAKLTEELWMQDLAASEPRCLSRDELTISGVQFLDDAQLVIAASDMAAFGPGQNRELLRVDVQSGVRSSLTPGWDMSIGNSVVADCRHGGGPVLRVDGDAIYAVVTDRSTSQVVRIPRQGKIAVVAGAGGSVDAFAVKGDTVLTVELRSASLHEVYRYDGAGESALTTLNESSLAARAVSVPEAFSVQNGDTQLDAWIIRPIDFDAGKRYPTILSVHGGPRASYGEVFVHEMQLLAGQGYVVVYTNPRGSSGRGNEFADLREKYGTIDYDDLMAVVDAAIERYPFVDGERLGITGGSYGGFMANWAIGQTERFKAAVSQRSIANWTCKFNTTDIGYYFNKDAMGTDPWANGGADKLWWHSPLKYADRAVTPTLFIHSEEDYRCWLAEGLQMFTALKYHGVDSRLVMFRGENHELSRSGKPTHRARRLQETLDWFDQYLKDS